MQETERQDLEAPEAATASPQETTPETPTGAQEAAPEGGAAEAQEAEAPAPDSPEARLAALETRQQEWEQERARLSGEVQAKDRALNRVTTEYQNLTANIANVRDRDERQRLFAEMEEARQDVTGEKAIEFVEKLRERFQPPEAEEREAQIRSKAAGETVLALMEAVEQRGPFAELTPDDKKDAYTAAWVEANPPGTPRELVRNPGGDEVLAHYVDRLLEKNGSRVAEAEAEAKELRTSNQALQAENATLRLRANLGPEEKVEGGYNPRDEREELLNPNTPITRLNEIMERRKAVRA